MEHVQLAYSEAVCFQLSAEEVSSLLQPEHVATALGETQL